MTSRLAFRSAVAAVPLTATFPEDNSTYWQRNDHFCLQGLPIQPIVDRKMVGQITVIKESAEKEQTMARVLTASFAIATLLFALDVQAQVYYPYAYSYSPSTYYYGSSIRSPRFAASPAFGIPVVGVPSVSAPGLSVPSMPGYTLVPVSSVDQRTPSYAVYDPGLGFVGWLQFINNAWQRIENKGQVGGGGSGGGDPAVLQAIKDNGVKLDALQSDVTEILRRTPQIPGPPPAAAPIPAPTASEAKAAAADANERLNGIIARLNALPLDKKK